MLINTFSNCMKIILWVTVKKKNISLSNEQE